MSKYNNPPLTHNGMSKKEKQAIYDSRRNREARNRNSRERAAKPNNRSSKTSSSKVYRDKNREKLRSDFKDYYAQNREACNARSAARRKDRLKTDPQYKIAKNCRRRILSALSITSSRKCASTVALLGCSVSQLKEHLESMFLPGMNWGNHGFYGWHIDHILPCASFDLTDPEQQRACFHYTNLQPLWAIDNLIKNDKLPETKTP